MYRSPFVKTVLSWKSTLKKTVIGRTEEGFDFFRYHISTEGLPVATKTVENFVELTARLYEPEPEGEIASLRLGL